MEGERKMASRKKKHFSALTINYHEEKAYRDYRAGLLTEEEYKKKMAEIEEERKLYLGKFSDKK
jgi:hypothetical protein